MAQNTKSAAIMPNLAGRIGAGAVQAVDDGCGVQTVAGVGLRVKEDFCVQHVVGLSTRVRYAPAMS